MIEGAWSRFLGYASHARTKPTFEFEERQPKLEAAAGLRQSIQAAREGGDWAPHLRQAFRLRNRDPLGSPRHHLIPLGPRRWLNEWAHREPDSLQGALAVFLDAELSPVERFTRFAEAAEEAGGDSSATLMIGSLLGFAVAPDSLPIVRAFFGQLRELLGVDDPGGGTVAEEYGAELEFARDVRARMESHSVPIVDMVDVQSLMSIGVREHALWGYDPPDDWASKSNRAVTSGGAYLAASTIYLNDAPYLREWIEFHRLVGVERFFLYDNGSSDNHLEVLAPYIDDGIVTLRAWRPSPPDHRDVFNDCLSAHREEARWIAFFDVDEFLFSPSGASVAELLRDYERWPGVGVNWAMFSHAGHRTRPDGLVIDSYPLRDRNETGWIKCIVDPVRTTRCESAHFFTYHYGLAVDENKWPIAEPQTKSTSFERLRINHYASRSEEEARTKSQIRGWKGVRQWRLRDLAGELELVRDDAISGWAPALRAALCAPAKR
jgi:hypothetical protein